MRQARGTASSSAQWQPGPICAVMIFSGGHPPSRQILCARRIARAARVSRVTLIAAAWRSGCAATRYVEVRSVPHSPLVDRLKLTSHGGPQPTDRTMQILRQYDLMRDLKNKSDPADRGQQAPGHRRPCPFGREDVLAGGIKLPGREGIEVRGRGHGARPVRSRGGERLPVFVRRAISPDPKYIRSRVSWCLRCLQRRIGKRYAHRPWSRRCLLPGHTHAIESESQKWNVTVVVHGGRWLTRGLRPLRVRLRLRRCSGLANQFHSYGLGVPLIAIRKNHMPGAVPMRSSSRRS